MPKHISIERLILTGGNRPGVMDIEAHILSSKNEMKTTAIVTLSIKVDDNPTLSAIQHRILLQTSQNLTPNATEKE